MIERIRLYEDLGNFLNALDGVSLDRYRVGPAPSSDTYTLFHDYAVKIDMKKGGWKSLWNVVPAITLNALAENIESQFKLKPESIKDSNEIVHLGPKDEEVLVQQIAYQTEIEQQLTVKGHDYDKLLEYIIIRTNVSFPTIHASFYRIDPDTMPNELLDVWVRLNKKGNSFEQYLEQLKK